MELLLSKEQFPCEATDWRERQKSSLTWRLCLTSFHSFPTTRTHFPSRLSVGLLRIWC